MDCAMKELCIRDGRPSDAAAIERLLATQRMASDVDPTEFIIAEAGGRLLGAVRLTWVATDHAFLRPIVVAPEVRREGIGRALLQRLFGVCGSISVAARSDAVPFYGSLGFAPIDWSSVPLEYRHECECCDEFATCRPVSMRWSSQAIVRQG